MPDYPAIDQTMKQALADGVFPGAVLLVARGEEVLIQRAYGFAALIPKKRPMSLDTVFDLASLTKPLATTLAVMALVAEGRLGLDQTFEELGEPFLYPGKENVSIRQLLAHTGGLPAYQPYYQRLVESTFADRKRGLRQMVQREPLENRPGTITVYSDLGFVYLEWIVETLRGQDLHGWTRENLYQPLGLDTMGFRPLSKETVADPDRYAATEDCPWRRKVLCGEVHDENTYAVGGVSGQAGLFGTAEEVFLLLRTLKKMHDRARGPGLFDGKLVRTFWQRQPMAAEKGRALGFDVPSQEGSSAGRFFSPHTVGHLGFAGTSFWFDLDRDFLVVLLTNRVHPTRWNERIRLFRPVLHDQIYQVLQG
jgi:CubicO group peptidase (beta-lactamase class C family)